MARLDIPEVIIVVLSVLAAAVWIDSLIFGRRDDRGTQYDQQEESMSGVEELAG